MSACYDCNRQYGSAGFPDLIVPSEVWRRISPTGDEGGLLCPSCLIARVSIEGIQCIGALMSGPIRTVDPELMWSVRMTENMLEREDRREAPAEPPQTKKDQSDDAV